MQVGLTKIISIVTISSQRTGSFLGLSAVPCKFKFSKCIRLSKDMAEQNVDQLFLEEIIKAIVNNPDEVKVTRTVDERGVLLTLDVNPTDIGYVIGRRGNTIRAVRTLLKVVGAKNNALVNLKVNEPEGGRPERPERREDAPRREESSATPVEEVDTSAIDNLDI